MENEKHYLLVGSFVLASLIGLALFCAWFVQAFDSSKYTPYRINFAESVSGLDVGGPVKFRGVLVGKVKAMAINAQDPRQIIVDVNILKTAPIKTDTIASLKLQGITGAIYIELASSDPQSPPLTSDDPNSPPVIKAQTSALTTLMDIMPAILEKVSHIAEQVDKVFSDQNVAAFGDMVAQWQKVSHDVGSLTHSIKENPSKLIIPTPEKGIPAP